MSTTKTGSDSIYSTINSALGEGVKGNIKIGVWGRRNGDQG